MPYRGMFREMGMLVLAASLCGCAAAVISGATTVGTSMAENRTLGRKVDDSVLYTDITRIFLEAEESALLARINFNTRFGRVMLTGTARTEEDARRAVSLVWKADGVREVINELLIRPDQDLSETANDSLIKRNLEARLLITRGVWVINYSIDVVDGGAYLIGRVKDAAEKNRVVNVARTTKGVKRVIAHLEINPARDIAESPVRPPAATTDHAPVDAVLIEENTPYVPQTSKPIAAPPVSQESTRPAY